MMKLVVLSCLVAVACGSGIIAPYAAAPFAYAAAPYYAYAPYSYPSNYRGPLSLAPGQPANILGADGRPLDTLDVNLDRSAHLTAKAYAGAGVHLLKKRSAPLLAAPLALHSAPILPYAASHYSTAYTAAAPYYSSAYAAAPYYAPYTTYATAPLYSHFK